MKLRFFILIFTITTIACSSGELKYILYERGNKALEITPNDILYYDTANNMGFIEYHKIVLKNDVFNRDSIVLEFPIKLVCDIGNKKYFWSDYFYPTQSQPRLHINFRLNSNCDNKWNTNYILSNKGDSLTVFFNDSCTSLDLLHMETEITQNLDYYIGRHYYNSYTDTARLAHEILFDPYYLNAIKESGIPIK